MKIIFDSSETLGYSHAEGLLAQGRDKTLEGIKCALKDRALEVWIFGSYARHKETKASDLDLIIITPTNKKFHRRVEDFEDLYESISPDIDIFVYTPEEFKKFLSIKDSPFWNQVNEDKVRIL